jgi:hypothetical protein
VFSCISPDCVQLTDPVEQTRKVVGELSVWRYTGYYLITFGCAGIMMIAYCFTKTSGRVLYLWLVHPSKEGGSEREAENIERTLLFQVMMTYVVFFVGLLLICLHAVYVVGMWPQKLSSRFSPLSEMQHTFSLFSVVTVHWKEVFGVCLLFDLLRRIQRAIRWSHIDESIPKSNEALTLYMILTWLFVWLLTKLGFFGSMD